MRMHRSLLIMVAAALVLALGFAGAQAANALRAQPTAVAVVDLARVFENLKEQQQIKADLISRQEALRTQAGERKKSVDTLQGELDVLAPGSAPYKQKESARDRAVIDLQVWSEFEARKLRMEEQLQVENLLRKVNGSIERIAAEQGYDLVMFKNQNVNMRAGEGQNAQINIRMVAYNAPSIELTDQIIQRMNNEFQAGAQ